MEIKIGKGPDRKLVDVSNKDCADRWCFQLGQDKGVYTPGRGYTQYYKTPKWVCLRRHLHGCPDCCPVCSGPSENGWDSTCNDCLGKEKP